LTTVRALIDLFEKRLATGEYGHFKPEVLQTKLCVLKSLEQVLDAADTYDRNFYFAMKDLA
jgi:hypothetical protein